ncbi:MAG: hypothetical protein WA151_23210, partial [Desulfatirhabdiaceae bacterium]
MKALDSYFTRQIIERLELKDSVLKFAIQLIGLMNEQNQVNVAQIHQVLFPLSSTNSANAQLNRLLSEIKRSAEEKNISLKVEITKDKKAGPKNRLVWFEGASEAPEAYTGELNAIEPIELIEDQRGLPTGEHPVVVLLTFNGHETSAVIRHFHPRRIPKTQTVKGITYNMLGVNGGMNIVH